MREGVASRDVYGSSWIEIRTVIGRLAQAIRRARPTSIITSSAVLLLYDVLESNGEWPCIK